MNVIETRSVASLALALGLSVLAGCEHSTLSPDGGSPGSPDLRSLPDLAPVLDAAGSDAFLPAPHPPLPQIPDHGGTRLDHPAFVTVTWKGDPLGPSLAAFDAWLTSSSYWNTLAEYGIAKGAPDVSYEIPTAAPALLDDADIATLLGDAIKSKLVPPVTSGRLYVVYPPAGTVVTNHYGGQTAYRSCDTFQTFHSVGPQLDAAGPILYAVVARCHYNGYADLDYTTWGASVEIAGTVTSPIYSKPAWAITAFNAASVYGGGVAQLCVSQPRTVETHLVGALYSNAAAAADKRPCLPAPDGPMFGVWAEPDELDAKAGQTVMPKLHVYSTAPLSKPLSLTVTLYPMAAGTAKTTQTLVQNGDTLPLTITLGAGVMSGYAYSVDLYLSGADYATDSHVLIHVP